MMKMVIVILMTRIAKGNSDSADIVDNDDYSNSWYS